ncbi:hypothetical protein PG997_008032 [Apiospora hydei]|uniref:Chromo domain-containing protein n=1 Tax=Apiospora hydei TaxID=1337664 RepID=A0ABR1W9N9_9PEZI
MSASLWRCCLHFGCYVSTAATSSASIRDEEGPFLVSSTEDHAAALASDVGRTTARHFHSSPLFRRGHVSTAANCVTSDERMFYSRLIPRQRSADNASLRRRDCLGFGCRVSTAATLSASILDGEGPDLLSSPEDYKAALDSEEEYFVFIFTNHSTNLALIGQERLAEPGSDTTQTPVIHGDFQNHQPVNFEDEIPSTLLLSKSRSRWILPQAVMSHLSFPSTLPPKPSETPRGAKMSGDAELLPTSVVKSPMKPKASTDSARGANSKNPILLTDDDGSASGNGKRSYLASTAGFFASGAPDPKHLGLENVSFTGTPPAKPSYLVSSEVPSSRSAPGSVSAAKPLDTLTPLPLKGSRGYLGSQPWMKAAVERRKAQASIAHLSQHNMDGHLSQPTEVLPNTTNRAQTTSGETSITSTKRMTRETDESPAPNNGNDFDNNVGASNDYRRSPSQTATADGPPVPNRQRRGDQSRRPDSPTSQHPHRDSPARSQTVETLPVSHPASSTTISLLGLASYEETAISDGVVKCVMEGGEPTFQIQFTLEKRQGAAYCSQHASNVKSQDWLHARSRRQRKLCRSPNRSNEAESDAVGEVDRIIARWGSGRHADFLLIWTDKTRDWIPRRDINEEMVSDFEKGYDGIHEGVEILGIRGKGVKKQYRLHWRGRPSKEDGWVAEKLISKQLLHGYEERQSGEAEDVSPKS